MTTFVEFEAAIDNIEEDADKLDSIVQGSATDPDITTTGGSVKTVLKWQGEVFAAQGVVPGAQGPEGPQGSEGRIGPTGPTGVAGAVGGEPDLDFLQTLNGVGSFAYLRYSSVGQDTILPGATRAWASAGNPFWYSDSNLAEYASVSGSGTWRCMGSITRDHRNTLFVRIA